MAETKNKDFLKDLKVAVHLEADASAGETLEATLKQIAKLEKDINLLKESDVEWAKDAIKTNQEQISQLKELAGLHKQIVDSKELSKDKNKQFFKGLFGFAEEEPEAKTPYEMGSIVGSAITTSLKKGAKFLKDTLDIEWTSLSDVINKSLDRLDGIVKSSFLTDQQTRSNLFTYGMSASQSYGFETAKTMLGVKTEEDLYYMNDFQRTKFMEVMNKYSEKYSELYDSGFFEKQLEFDIAKQEFQQDVELAFAQMFIDNKDVIIGAMNALIEIMRVVNDISSALHSTASKSASDIFNSVTNSSNVNIDTTFNIQGQVSNETLNKIGDMNVQSYITAINNL